MRILKVTIAIVFVGILISLLAGRSLAYPPFVAKAKKFGAKDCTFCHVDPEGGPPWNDRGQWLIKEKERRGADSVDVDWLADYKPPADKKDDKAAPKEDKKDEKVTPKEDKKDEKKDEKKSAPQKPPVAAGSTEQELLNLERELIDAFVGRDVAAIERILADDFLIIYSDGSLSTKADEIANLKKAVRKGPAPKVTTEEVRVRVYGDTAVLTGVIVHEGSYESGPRGGQAYKTRQRYTDVYVRRAGKWQVASSQVTDIRSAEETAYRESGFRVDPKILDAYVGDYELPMFVLTITRDADRLFGQPQGDSKRELIALSETDFNVGGEVDGADPASHGVNARIVFVKDTAGNVSGMKVSVNGEQFEGKKIK